MPRRFADDGTLRSRLVVCKDGDRGVCCIVCQGHLAIPGAAGADAGMSNTTTWYSTCLSGELDSRCSETSIRQACAPLAAMFSRPALGTIGLSPTGTRQLFAALRLAHDASPRPTTAGPAAPPNEWQEAWHRPLRPSSCAISHPRGGGISFAAEDAISSASLMP
jgi:hypothetical protein